MAMSCARLCHLSLARLYGVRINGVTVGLYSSVTATQTRSLCRPCRPWTFHGHYSSSKARPGSRDVVSRIGQANSRYEIFLKRRFPRFYQLYHTFVEGFKLLFQDAKEFRRITSKGQDLSYRDLEKLRQIRRDMMKAIPLVLISIPPFANYLVFLLMYLFPRQLLIPHFWTPAQQVEFRAMYHTLRVQHHGDVLRGLELTARRVQDDRLGTRLQDLCRKVLDGAHPEVSEIHAVRSLFSGPPLGMKRMSSEQMRHICPLLFLTPRLPAFLIGRRLSSHALELLQLDRALGRLGPQQLSDAELRQACYLRGLDAHSLSPAQCHAWLSQWLRVSAPLKESELSLLLHSMVFLSANYPPGAHHHHRH